MKDLAWVYLLYGTALSKGIVNTLMFKYYEQLCAALCFQVQAYVGLFVIAAVPRCFPVTFISKVLGKYSE